MKLHMNESNAKAVGMYDPRFEHDNCGIGAVVNIKGVKTHQTVENALKIVENLKHRAGKDAEGKTGDGVGILLQISHRFFSKTMKSLGVFLGEERDYGIGMFFFPQDELKRNQAKKMFEVIIEKEGLELLAWREVPTDPTVIGQKAVDCMPYIMQAFIKRPDDVEKGLDFDRRLYVARRVFEQSNDNTYVVSLSSRTIVYKGMFLVNELRLFFKDLQDPDYESAIAMVHSRFSTNTNPSWSCALNIRTRDSERIVPRNVESQHELASFVPIIVHINRVDKRVDDTPLILNIFYITPLERFEPIHDSLLRQEGLFHFLPGNLPFEVSAFFFQLLKTFLRCWCDNALLYCRHEVLDSLIGLLQSFL